MKTPDKQLLASLLAYPQDAVLKAIDLYKQGIDDNFRKTGDELKEDGWFPQKEKPEGKEFYFIKGTYWVQSDKIREKSREEQIKNMRKNRENKDSKKQNMSLKATDISCPRCKGQMYKQGICGGCKEGKKGFSIRLICEENPDHEILL